MYLKLKEEKLSLINLFKKKLIKFSRKCVRWKTFLNSKKLFYCNFLPLIHSYGFQLIINSLKRLSSEIGILIIYKEKDRMQTVLNPTN